MANNYAASEHPAGAQPAMTGLSRPPYHVVTQGSYPHSFGHPPPPLAVPSTASSAGAALSMLPSYAYGQPYNPEYSQRQGADGVQPAHGLAWRYAAGCEGGVTEGQRQTTMQQDRTILVSAVRPIPMPQTGYPRGEGCLLNGENGEAGPKAGLGEAEGRMRMPTQSIPVPSEQQPNVGPMMLDQLSTTAELLAGKGDFAGAINFYERLTTIDPDNGGCWTALGHCYLLTDELQKAFGAYQKALYSLPDVRDPQLWYGIGLLYDKVD